MKLLASLFTFCFAVIAMGTACQETDSTALPQPVRWSLGNDTVICYHDSITLDAGTGSLSTDGPDGNRDRDGQEGGKRSIFYLWSDSSTAQTITVSRADTVSVTVTDSAGTSISDTIIIGIKYSVLQGYLRQNNGVLASGNTMILFKHNLSDTLFTGIDTTTTDSTGFYQFSLSDTLVYLKALPDSSAYSELATYYGNAFIFQSADMIAISPCDTFIADINLINMTGTTGSGMLGGVVKNEKGNPVSGLPLILTKNEGQPLFYSITHSNGYFNFPAIAYGDYAVWADHPYINNTPFPPIAINEANSDKGGLNFTLHEEYLQPINYTYESLQDALQTPKRVYILALNSLRYDVKNKTLNLEGEQVSVLPAIGKLVNMEELSLGFNLITGIPPEIGNLTKLWRLQLPGNKLSSLPDEMQNLQALKELLLMNNKFETFPSVITKLLALEKLNLQNNKLTSIPVEIANLKNLKTLSLASNFGLVEVPAAISELTKLRRLSFANCAELKRLPEEIIQLKNLKHLNLNYTKISKKQMKAIKEALPDCKIDFLQE